MRPIIGFTSTYVVDVNEQNDYADAIVAFGGLPRCLVARERGGKPLMNTCRKLMGCCSPAAAVSTRPASINRGTIP